MNWQAMLYKPLYDGIGVDAVLDLGSDGTVPLRVIDKTDGIEVALGGDVSVTTIKPACAIRVYELTSKDVPLADLKGHTITFNSNTWRIEGRLPKPGPNGEADGEVLLTLIAANV